MSWGIQFNLLKLNIKTQMQRDHRKFITPSPSYPQTLIKLGSC
jgi:hypothetical protein